MDNPDLVGVYIGYEPNAFDGKDAEFVNFDEAQMAAAAEEQTASMKELARSAQELASMAENLQTATAL